MVTEKLEPGREYQDAFIRPHMSLTAFSHTYHIAASHLVYPGRMHYPGRMEAYVELTCPVIEPGPSLSFLFNTLLYLETGNLREPFLGP